VKQVVVQFRSEPQSRQQAWTEQFQSAPSHWLSGCCQPSASWPEPVQGQEPEQKQEPVQELERLPQIAQPAPLAVR
jgi:hypothetical protein